MVKQQKIATVRKLPVLIEEGSLLEDGVQNYHAEKEAYFAYFLSSVLIDGERHDVSNIVLYNCQPQSLKQF